MPGRMSEVFVGGKQGELVPAAELDEQRIDSSDLHAGPAARVANVGGGNVVGSVWRNNWQGPKPVNDRRGCSGFVEALQELLQNQTGSHDGIGACQRF